MVGGQLLFESEGIRAPWFEEPQAAFGVLGAGYKTPSLKAIREEASHPWVPMEDRVKCISLKVLFWPGVEAKERPQSTGT